MLQCFGKAVAAAVAQLLAGGGIRYPGPAYRGRPVVIHKGHGKNGENAFRPLLQKEQIIHDCHSPVKIPAQHLIPQLEYIRIHGRGHQRLDVLLEDLAGVAVVGCQLFHLLPQPQAVQIAIIRQQGGFLRFQYAAQPQRGLPREFPHIAAGHGSKAAHAARLIAQVQQLGGRRFLFGKLPGAAPHRQDQHPVLRRLGQQLRELAHAGAAQAGGIQVIHYGALAPGGKAHRP